jgi:hypothetical protein
MATSIAVTLVRTNPMVMVEYNINTKDRLLRKITAADAPNAIAAEEYAALSICWFVSNHQKSKLVK